MYCVIGYVYMYNASVCYLYGNEVHTNTDTPTYHFATISHCCTKTCPQLLPQQGIQLLYMAHMCTGSLLQIKNTQTDMDMTQTSLFLLKNTQCMGMQVILQQPAIDKRCSYSVMVYCMYCMYVCKYIHVHVCNTIYTLNATELL